MKDDPIIAEVRAAREEIAKRAGYDLDKLFDILKDNEQKWKLLAAGNQCAR